MFTRYVSIASGILSIMLFAYSTWGALGGMLLMYLAFGWFVILLWMKTLGLLALEAFLAPWPTLNVVAAAVLLFSRPARVPAWYKIATGGLGCLAGFSYFCSAAA